MTSRRRITAAIVTAAALLLVAAVVLKWRDNRQFADPALQLSRFPVEDAIVVSMDFSAIRSAGLLGPSKAPLEPEYKQFLDTSGFDYRRDLDHVLASISKSGNYFLVTGRFNWNRLSDYARQQGGSCYQSLCRMPGSTPQRRISFLPLREDTMALAVSTDDLAASRLTKTGNPVKAQLPSAPVWLSMPGAALRQEGAMPNGMRLMLSALTSADRIDMTMGPSSAGVEARLDATCRNSEDAGVLASQLRNTARTIRDGIAGKTLAQDDEFARMLATGTFEQKGSRVSGKWDMPKALLESLTTGL